MVSVSELERTVFTGNSPVQSPACTRNLQHNKVKASQLEKTPLCTKILLLILKGFFFTSRKVPGRSCRRETLVAQHSSWKLWKKRKNLRRGKRKTELQIWLPSAAVKALGKGNCSKCVNGLGFDLLVLHVTRKKTAETQKGSRSNGGLTGCERHREKCKSW